MRHEYTRDVSESMMKELMPEMDGAGGSFQPWVAFVKKHQKELALCFRGNASGDGEVTIYRHNHRIWELGLDRTLGPVARINLDHARFLENWYDDVFRQLLELGYVPADPSRREAWERAKAEAGGTGGEPGDLRQILEGMRGKIVKESKAKNGNSYTYQYSAGMMLYEISPRGKDGRPHSRPKEEVAGAVEASYRILRCMQEAYFYSGWSGVFYDPEKREAKRVSRPTDHIEKHFLETRGRSFAPWEILATSQPCVEKHVQQELFRCNHNFRDGLFIYDLEFAQPDRKGLPKEIKKNQPDMFGLRFEKGALKAICLIEVKSTEAALSGSCGVAPHKKGMEAYVGTSVGGRRLMEDRKKEAYRILRQYAELGLYGVKLDRENRVYGSKAGKYDEDFFLKLREEIIFVFSHGIGKDTRVEGQTIGEIMEGYELYGGVACMEKTYGGITAMKKEIGSGAGAP